MGLKKNINRALKETHAFNAYYRGWAYVKIYAYDIKSVEHLVNEARNSEMDIQFVVEDVLQLFDNHKNLCGMIFAAIKERNKPKFWFYFTSGMPGKPVMPHKKSYYDEEKHMYYEPIHL